MLIIINTIKRTIVGTRRARPDDDNNVNNNKQNPSAHNKCYDDNKQQ